MTKQKQRGTPRRRKAKPRAKSKALTLRARSSELSYVPLAPAPLTQEPLMAPTWVGTLKLTEDQIKALRKPVDDSEIEWKAAVKNGPPEIPYLSHNGYRDRLDAAFGLGGWGMVPCGLPREMPSTRQGDDATSRGVYVPYQMVVGGLPRIFAWGEQEMHRMTYGDALEGAKSNAIVRCGKELGIARELWDKRTVDGLKARVLKHAGRGSTADQAREENPHANETISDPQRKRLWAIAKNRGRLNSEVEVWLAAKYQITDTRKIKRGDYDAICKAIEAAGPLVP